jgi:RNA polymerase sigma-70 factor, ECF subfamily
VFRRASEGELVRRAASGDANATGELFRRHAPGAWRAAFLVTGDSAAAEDATQEGFLEALHQIGRFDSQRPFAPWLHRIVVNRAVDAWRRTSRVDVSADVVPAELEWREAPFGDGELRAALAALGPDQRAVIALRYLLDYSTREIAALLEVPEGTVYSRLGRALEALRSLLEVPA